MPYKDPEKKRESIRKHYQTHKEYYRARNQKRREETREWLDSFNLPESIRQDRDLKKALVNQWSKGRIVQLLQEKLDCDNQKLLDMRISAVRERLEETSGNRKLRRVSA